MNNELSFHLISFGDIYLIQPLWEKLRILHRDDSVHFKDFYERFTFETRIEKFARQDSAGLRAEIAKDSAAVIGYCVSTMEGDAGEIDSICIEDDYRGKGIGDRLVRNALEWFAVCGATRVTASVAHGHESVWPFYRKYGFFPRLTVLERKG
ncbi:MAG TPA: GNAT family N-acetyltransferase [Spirochaetota bacterium]|nr:GNAT family N-acetyltransferase [Spirochaetota bacterium]